MINAQHIQSVHWQPKLGEIGDIVTDIADIDQCIRLILETPKGSDPHRPDFGSDLHQYIDWPQNRITPHLVRETFHAIRAWEPRIEVVRVKVTHAEAAVKLAVTWRPVDGIGLQHTETSFAR